MFLVGLFIIVLLHWFFWPKKGGLALILKLKRNNKRILIEDGLKLSSNVNITKAIVM
jgi:hypothetical protein